MRPTPVDASAAAEIRLHEIMLADLAREGSHLPFDDPHGLAVQRPGRLRALLENPYRGDEHWPARILAVAGNQIVGRIDVIPTLLDVKGITRPFAWTSHLEVAPTMRRRGIGRKMIELQQRHIDGAGGTGMTPSSELVLARMGYAPFPLTRLVLANHAVPVLERALKRSLPIALRPVLELPARLATAAARRLGRGRLRAREVHSIPPQMDPLLARSESPLSFRRSAAWIGWLLRNRFDDPKSPAEGSGGRAFLIEDRAGGPMAYFLIRIDRIHPTALHPLRGLTVATLIDWLVFDRAAISERGVILHALEFLCDGNVDLVEIFPIGPKSHALLRLLGFLPWGRVALAIRLTGTPPGLDAADPGSWRLRAVEGDNFFN